MVDSEYDCLKLENQLCFPLYVCSKEIVRRYTPYLEPLGITYTQYITMMALWEFSPMSVKELGDKISLDSGTLTPLLKKLEDKGFITRERSKRDERSVRIKLTEGGYALRDKAKTIPMEMCSNLNVPKEEVLALQDTIKSIIASLKENDFRPL